MCRCDDERESAKKALQSHYIMVKKERAHCYGNAVRAVLNPRMTLSIAQDGTSQLPRGVPQFPTAIHGEEKSTERLAHKFTLTMVHHLGTRCYAVRDNVFNDPNLTIECLQRTLKWVEESQGFLPPHLIVQLDNCWRENKNSYVVNWLASLVERGVFASVELSFLPVGHTHNEVDQVASRISIALRHRTIATMDDLHALFAEAFPTMPLVVVDDVANSAEFLNPGRTKLDKKKQWSQGRWRRIQNVADYRFFRTSKNAAGHIECRHKASFAHEWAHPYYLLRGQGQETGGGRTKNKFKERVLQADGYTSSVLRVDITTRATKATEDLEAVRGRLSTVQWAALMRTYEVIYQRQPIPFHWQDGGVFLNESKEVPGPDDMEDEEDEMEMQEEGIRTTAPRGLYEHWNQVTAHRINPEPSHILVGNFVCVGRSSPSGDAAGIPWAVAVGIGPCSEPQHGSCEGDVVVLLVCQTCHAHDVAARSLFSKEHRRCPSVFLDLS